MGEFDIMKNEIIECNNVEVTSLDILLNKILDNPSDFFEKICFALTVQERLFILRKLKNKSCLNCTNGSCDIEYSEKIGNDEFGNPQGSECIGWFNADVIGRCKVLRKVDINELLAHKLYGRK